MTYRYLLNLKLNYDDHIDTNSFLVVSPCILFPIIIKDCLKTANNNCALLDDDSNYPFAYADTGINLDTLSSALEHELSNNRNTEITIQEFFSITESIKFPIIIDDAFNASIDFETNQCTVN